MKPLTRRERIKQMIARYKRLSERDQGHIEGWVERAELEIRLKEEAEKQAASKTA